MNEISSNNDNASVFTVVQPKVDKFGGKKLADLNTDVLSLIFDEFEILDMIKLLTAYPANALSLVAKQSFWRKFKDHVLFIDEANNHEFIVLDDRSKRIIMYPNNCGNVLKVFGNLIQHLQISFPSNVTIETVNKYTSESLINLKMSFVAVDVFDGFTTPFAALKSLEIRTYVEIKTGQLPLNQLFPNLRRLSLDLFRDVGFAFIIWQYPYLEHFKLYSIIYHQFPSQNEEILMEFFQKNTQIQSIDVKCLNEKLCNIINGHVANLQNLTIETHNIQIDNDTTIEKLKHFSISQSEITDQHQSMSKLTLPRLETLQIVYGQPIAAVWIEFFRKHQHVSHLKIIDAYQLDDDLNQLIDEMPNLIEISFEQSSVQLFFTYAIIVENINRIIETHSQLVKMDFSYFRFSENEMNNFQLKFDNQWNIIVDNYRSDDPDRLVNIHLNKRIRSNLFE